MRLPLTILGSAALLVTAMPLRAHADPVCAQAGWTDPETGAHPEDGPCADPLPEQDNICHGDGVTSSDPNAGVSYSVCVLKPAGI